MKAIETKYVPATNTKPSRIKAMTADRKISITIPYNHEGSVSDAHSEAAVALCHKLDWKGALVMGALNETGYVFCFDNAAKIIIGEE